MAGNGNNNNNSEDWIKIIFKNEDDAVITQFDMHIKGKENNWDQITKDAIVLLKKIKPMEKLLEDKYLASSVAADKKSVILKITRARMNGGRRRASRKASRKSRRKSRRHSRRK